MPNKPDAADGLQPRLVREGLCLIDQGWLTDVVHQFCRQSEHAALLMPARRHCVTASRPWAYIFSASCRLRGQLNLTCFRFAFFIPIFNMPELRKATQWFFRKIVPSPLTTSRGGV